MTAIFAGLAALAWQAGTGVSEAGIANQVPQPAFAFFILGAVVSLYFMFAPLLHWPPYRQKRITEDQRMRALFEQNREALSQMTTGPVMFYASGNATVTADRSVMNVPSGPLGPGMPTHPLVLQLWDMIPAVRNLSVLADGSPENHSKAHNALLNIWFPRIGEWLDDARNYGVVNDELAELVTNRDEPEAQFRAILQRTFHLMVNQAGTLVGKDFGQS